jgi:hypothetical protein
VQQSLIARLLVILGCAWAPANASAHGVTEAAVFVAAAASIERCSDDHPRMHDQLAQALKSWIARHDFPPMSPDDRIAVEKGKAEWRKVVAEGSGPSSEPECRLLIRSIESEDQNVDLSTTPEAVAVFLGLAKACEEVIPGYRAMLASHPRETKWEQSVAFSHAYEAWSSYRAMLENVYETKRGRTHKSRVSECKDWVPWKIDTPPE